MSTWTKQKLGDILALEYGKGLVAGDRISGPYPVFGSSGNVGTHAEYLIKGPGIIVGRKGSVGEVYYTKNNYFPIDTVYFVRNNDKEYDCYFLYTALKALNLKRLQGDTGVPGLNREAAYGETILLPDLPTQTRIASVLSAYDDLIENNEKRIKILEEMAERLYREWFVKFQFPGHEKVRLIDSGTEYGKIPEGWEMKKLGDIIDLRTGLSYKASHLAETGIPIATMGIVSTKTRFQYDHLKFYDIDSDERFYLNIGDIVLCTHDVTQKKEVIGYPAIIPADIGKKIILGANLFGVKLKKEYVYNFIYHLLRSSMFRDRMRAFAKGTNILFIKRSDILNCNFVEPSNKILAQYDLVTDPINSLIGKLTVENRNLSKTRDLLIPQLVTGKREVKN